MLKRLVLLLVCEVSLYNIVTSAKVCGRPPQVSGARVQDEMQVYEPGQEIIYQCNPGYRITAGSRKNICKATGTWPSPTMKCSPKLCSYPGPLVNGHVLFSSLEFQTTVNFTCLEGYILHGHNDSECQHDSTWSNPLPVCKPVTCGLPEIPKYGLIKHHTKLTENTTYFGDTVQYECSSPYVLFGNEFGSCSANGNWTETPECKLVTCPPPTDIENGFMSFAILRKHGYGEKIRYGCKPNYVLDGSMEIQCEKTGHWSTKPVCRASCIISAKRARIFYNGQKIWVKDLPARRVQHADMVAFYCKDKDRACGYPVLTQCVDGNLIIPSCYEEPSSFTYNMNYGILPSEIKQC
ncbi:beta-2-glycoprotein 1-like [Huso huso]|uniref:Beta-2-glycoprotein 1 n=1 Tax=Huso huso TaxID=61971 RepID=A0ABR0Z029_HUSHU